MIQYSRWQIHHYAHSNASVLARPSLHLHNDYRGFCGNGYSARMYDLYGETAAEEFNSPDPAVRARALQVSIEVFDWINGVTDGPFIELLKKAGCDTDPTIRKIAGDCIAENFKSLG